MKTRDKSVRNIQGKGEQTHTSVSFRKGMAHISVFIRFRRFPVTFISWFSTFYEEQRQSNTNIENGKRNTEKKQRKQEKSEETPTKKENGC
jgi:hypothetical protein